MRRFLKRAALALASLAVLGFAGSLCLTWWFAHATPGQYRHFFNFIYRHQSQAAFNHEANGLLVETVANLAPGRALDIAMGEGRNAVYLAGRGWDVTGFDVSDEALEQANARAAKAGVRARFLREGSQTFDYGHEQWDLIVLSYAFAPIHDAAYIRRLRDSLKPSGVIVFEHYIRPPGMGRDTGTPDRGELLRLFSGFEIRRHEEVQAASDWQGRRRAALARLVAVKPPA